MIGWVAAGGYWLDTSILLIFLFFVIGQIPHFWLLLLKYGKQYEKAGLPSLTSFFSDRQISRISVGLDCCHTCSIGTFTGIWINQQPRSFICIYVNSKPVYCGHYYTFCFQAKLKTCKVFTSFRIELILSFNDAASGDRQYKYLTIQFKP
jgi:hypothetical protein